MDKEIRKKRVLKASLRQFQEPDLPSVHELIHQTIDACYTGIYPPRAVGFFKEYHSPVNILKRHREGCVFVVEEDGRMVATGTLVGEEICGVFVNPQFQGRGYGALVMGELERQALAIGRAETKLSISLPSRKFYERLGYEIQEECSFDVGEGQQLRYWQARKLLGKRPLSKKKMTN
jgi:GNAT superfamily N-acetyltransferase